MKNILAVAITSCALAFAGCGGGSDTSSTSSSPSSSQPAAKAAPAGTASIAGSVKFQGTAPAPVQVRLGRECRDLNEETVMAQNVLVNANGTLQNVFVYVKSGLEGHTFAPPTEPVIFDQRGCMYKPHVFGVQVGQPIKILNSDPLLHNIHAMPEVNRPFNFGMPRQGDEREREFRSEEVMVYIKCDVHPWMGAYAGVVSHPYHSVTGDTGAFSLKGLPAGTYVVEAWHEEYGTQTQNVTVGDGEASSVDFTFSPGAAS